MINQSEILATVYACMDELNQQLPDEGKIAKAPDAILVGEGGALDSLGLITLLVNLEQALADKHGLKAPLLDELMAEHAGAHPFHTVNTLLAWLTGPKAASKAG